MAKETTLRKKTKLRKEANELWQQACLKKWGSNCVCGERAVQVHHFIPKSRNGLMRYDIENGVPICQKCHYIIHFSADPTEVYRVVDLIRRKRGKGWIEYIDDKKKIHGVSFNNIRWLEEQIKKLRD